MVKHGGGNSVERSWSIRGAHCCRSCGQRISSSLISPFEIRPFGRSILMTARTCLSLGSPSWLPFSMRQTPMALTRVKLIWNLFFGFLFYFYGLDDFCAAGTDSCEGVVIEDCYICVGDDGIAIKSGWDQYGIAYRRPSTNILIRNVILRSTVRWVMIRIAWNPHDHLTS